MTLRDELWDLVPAVYRERDAEPNQAGALRALIEVLGEQAELVAEDLARLYDNWFIETCEPWVVPYIGDLVGARGLHGLGPVTPAPTARAYVANTIAYRRRKGTPAVLEQLARDVTGWPAHVVERFSLLATTQNVNHRRPGNVRTPDLRRGAQLDHLGGPFETATHTADTRPAADGGYGIPSVALFVWRLEPFQLFRSDARPATGMDDGRFHVEPTGRDLQLFNPPLPEESITSLATSRHVPGPLSRRALFDELEARRAGASVGDASFFGVDPVLEVFADLGTGLRAVPPEEMTSADLSDPPASAGVSSGWRRPAAPVLVAVDPVLGRLAFRDGVAPGAVEVSYCYAFGAQIGAGPFGRPVRPDVASILEAATFTRAVGSQLPTAPDLVRTSLTEALADWSAEPAGTVGVIALLDNRTQPGLFPVDVPAGSTLLIAAGSWPAVEAGSAGTTPDLAQFQLDEHRPHLLGDLTIQGGSGGGPTRARGRLALDGLLVDGTLTVADGALGTLQIGCCTIVPGRGGIRVDGNRDLDVTIDRSIIGPVRISDHGVALNLDTSVVDGEDGVALDASRSTMRLVAVTVLGDARCGELHATDCLVTGSVDVAKVQQGCVRFSYLGDTVRAPRRFRCQPDLALRNAADPAATRARLRPQLVSDRYGDPGYAMLADRCASELLTGSSRRSDVGVFGHLLRPQRMANLATALDEYLRFGLQAGVIPVT